MFDRPTPFPLNAFSARPIRSTPDATAIVSVLPLQAQYFYLEIFGGDRHAGDFATTRWGIVLAGRRAVLDAYGNLPLDEVDAAEVAGARWTQITPGGPIDLTLGYITHRGSKLATDRLRSVVHRWL
ncbi:MAG: hypothetical protein INR70_14230 [Parafilimonas terrae]|nr:hypothetical protein [Parafilimonas terrae]